MRCIVVVVTLAFACTPAPQAAPAEHTPAVPDPVTVTAATAPVPAPVVPAPVPAPVAPTVASPGSTPTPAPALQVGPDRYQFPEALRCDDQEVGPFCGVHIIDLATRKTTTLLSRDRTRWAVRAGRTETPTSVEFIAMPASPQQLGRLTPLFHRGPSRLVSLTTPHPIVPEPFTLTDVHALGGDFVLVGDKLYAEAIVKGSVLLEIDPKSKSSRVLDLRGKSPLAIFPAGADLALYLSGRRKNSIALFDLEAQKISTEMEFPRDLEPECKRSHHYYDEQTAVYVPASGLFYVGFDCFPDA